jgi:hypothetical protein
MTPLPMTNVESANRYGNTSHMKVISSSNSTKSLPRGGDAKLTHTDRINNVGKSMISTTIPVTSANVNIYSNNTLPKPVLNSGGSNNNSIRSSSRSSITEVVNKLPAVINIPTSMVISDDNQKPQPSMADGIGQPVLMKESANQATKHVDTVQKSSIRTSQCGKINVANPTTATMVVVPTTNHKSKVKSLGEKPLPVLTTSNNCANPVLHFLPNDTSLDDEYLSECENCKSAHGSRYYLEEEVEEPQETMTLQRKMPDDKEEDQHNYYRVSATLPSNTNKKAS